MKTASSPEPPPRIEGGQSVGNTSRRNRPKRRGRACGGRRDVASDSQRRRERPNACGSSSYPRIRHEAAIRLFASDLGDPAALVESLRALREQLPALEQLCDSYEERAQAIPHRTRAIELELSLARRLIRAHREWVDEVEGELGR